MVAWDYIFSHKIFDLCYNRLMNGHEAVQKFLNVGQMSPIISGRRYQAPTTSGSVTGDVILPSTQRSKSKPWKKILVIGIMVAAVAVIGVILSLLMGSKTEKNTLSDVIYSFDEFANYMLYEKESDVLDSTYEGGYNYKLTTEVFNEKTNDSYWNITDSLTQKTTTQFEKFIQGQQEDGAQSSLPGFYVNFMTEFQFLRQYKTMELPNEEKILEKYLVSGYDVASQYIQDAYRIWNDAEIESIKNYATAKSNQYHAFLSILVEYEHLGCISEGKINESCSNEQSGNLEILNYHQLANEEEDLADALMSSITSKVEVNVFAVSDFLKKMNNPEVDDEDVVTDESAMDEEGE